MQVLAAQWVHDAVAAYNSLIEHVSTMPQQTGTPSESLTTFNYSCSCTCSLIMMA